MTEWKCHPVPQTESVKEGAVPLAASVVKLRSQILMLLCYFWTGPSQVSGVALVAEDGGGAYLYTRWEN